jgi:hypothetical protein
LLKEACLAAPHTSEEILPKQAFSLPRSGMVSVIVKPARFFILHKEIRRFVAGMLKLQK